MILSLIYIILLAIILADVFNHFKLPKLIGFLITGIILGPYVLDLIDSSILNISKDIRQVALVIILIKAGLSLNLKDLKKVGRSSILMSFIPATFELIAYMIFAPLLLNISLIDALIMGAVLSAVSPAVVVPRMVNLIDNNYGTKKGIPQLILAGSSIDDIYVIVLFTTFLNIGLGDSFNLISFINIPISIILGILLGVIFGYILNFIFRLINFDDLYKVLFILAFAFILITIENLLENIVAISGLLATIAMANVLNIKLDYNTTTNLKNNFSKLWLIAEIFLFVLVGAEVNISYAFNYGFNPIIIIFISLIIRSIGVYLCVLKTNLNNKEKIFCIISYLPKATVQAAIGSIPLYSGLSSGDIILTVAVLAILITAPLGATLIDNSYKKLLTND